MASFFYGDSFIIPPPTGHMDFLFSFLFETSPCCLRDGDRLWIKGKTRLELAKQAIRLKSGRDHMDGQRAKTAGRQRSEEVFGDY